MIVKPPPRLLLGTAFLFWGAMTGRPLIGLLLALVAEASHWTRLRWDFDEDAHGRAWQLTTLVVTLASVLIWLEGNRYTALPNLLSWMPLLLFPMQFIQSFGMRNSMPLNAFSFLAKRRRERNRRLGLPEETTVFNFGNVTFGTCLMASAVGGQASSWMFLPGLVLLGGWALLASGNSTLRTLVPMLAIAGTAGFFGKHAIEAFEEWLGRGGAYYRSGFDPNHTRTMIGTPGRVVQSPNILWRLWTPPGTMPPRLLRTATFNTFIGTHWHNNRVAASDFNDVDTRLIGDTAYYLLDRPAVTDFEETVPSTADEIEALLALPTYHLRGTAAAESPLPLPGDAAAVRDFGLEGLERNTFGTVRVFPKASVIDGTVLWRGSSNPDSPPIPREDQHIHRTDGEMIAAAVETAGLRRGGDLRENLDALRRWFHSEFRYTTQLTIRYGAVGPDGDFTMTALGRFLNDTRAGHCEYFATAAVLMLRDLGIPARYAIGYGVMERDAKRGGYVIRGTHGHAWCRVWDEGGGRWLDFDPTPPDWFGASGRGLTFSQKFGDTIKRWREDFFIWRAEPGNRLGVSLGMTFVGLALAAFVAVRLWRSRRRIEVASVLPGYAGVVRRTPLHELETRARKVLGHRPRGQTFIAWLAPLRPGMPDPGAFDEAVALHQRLRFDPSPAAGRDQQRLTTLAGVIRRSISRPPEAARTQGVRVGMARRPRRR